MAYRRRVFRLDRLVIGARPDKLSSQSEIPTAAVPAPLSDAEEAALAALRTKLSVQGRLEPDEHYKYWTLCARPRRTR